MLDTFTHEKTFISSGCVMGKHTKYWQLISRRQKALQFLNLMLFSCFIIAFSFQNAYCENIGQIEPRVGSNSFNTYVWDGKVVKARTGATCETTWRFDGKKLRKNCGATSSNTYLWNGRRFKPVMGATGETSWIWNGTELRRQVGSTSGSTWRFNGHYWFLKQGATGRTSWVISGFVPIPVCALVILGLNGAD